MLTKKNLSTTAKVDLIIPPKIIEQRVKVRIERLEGVLKKSYQLIIYRESRMLFLNFKETFIRTQTVNLKIYM